MDRACSVQAIVAAAAAAEYPHDKWLLALAPSELLQLQQLPLRPVLQPLLDP
jgi:hypothetical protein